jgi:Trypsin-like peptidase domain
MSQTDTDAQAGTEPADFAITGPTDDRQDLSQIGDQRILNDAQTVVSLWKVEDVTHNTNGTTSLDTHRYGDRLFGPPGGPFIHPMCSTESFVNQRSGAIGSGFLVARDVIATAAHCIDKVAHTDAEFLASVCFVFGFSMPTTTHNPTVVKTTDVYTGVQVIARSPRGAPLADWALIRLNRPVKNGRIASVRRSGKVGDGRPVHIIGHPHGLPLKVAGNARVTANSTAEYFEADLDALAASSGSPVFDSVTHEVEGIYVRSRYSQEFVPAPGKSCYTIRLIPRTPLPGQDGPDEESTRVTLFSSHLGPGWQELDDNPATLAIAAGAPLGPIGPSLYQLHGTGALWRYNGTPMVGWELLDTNGATVEVATDGSTLYQRHSGSGAIWRYTNIPLFGWERVGGNSLTKSIVATQGLENGWLYQLQGDGEIWRFNSNNAPFTGWELLDSNPSSTAIAADRDRLYQMHSGTGAIWQYTGEAGFEWVQLGGNPLTKQILASGGQLYQLQSDGVIWRYTGTPMTGWQQLGNNRGNQGLAHDGLRLYALRTDGSVWRYTGVSVTGWQRIDDDPNTKAIVGAGRELYQLIARPRVGSVGAVGRIKRLVG